MSFKKETIGDVLELITNGVNCKQNKEGIGVKITRIETISNREINYEKIGFSNLTEDEKNKYRLIKGDILFSHINSPIHVGKAAVYNGSEDLYHGVNLLKLRVKNHINPYYFKYFLDGVFQSGYWRRTSKQSVNQASVNQTDIKKINFLYPSLAEQQRIVAKLDVTFSEINKIENSLQKNKNKIKNFFDSYILKFFKKDNSNKEIKPLKELCENYRNDIVDGPFGSNLKSKDFTDKGIPVLKIQNVKEFLINNKKMVYVSKTKFEELKRHTFKKGDIVMTKLGEPLGVSAIVENIESGVIVADLVRIRANKINTEFLCFQLNSSENRKYINSKQKGTTRARITLSVIRDLPIYCPNKSQQEKILKKVKSIKSNIIKLEKIYLHKENNLKSLKNSMLNNFLIKTDVA